MLVFRPCALTQGATLRKLPAISLRPPLLKFLPLAASSGFFSGAQARQGKVFLSCFTGSSARNTLFRSQQCVAPNTCQCTDHCYDGPDCTHFTCPPHRKPSVLPNFPFLGRRFLVFPQTMMGPIKYLPPWTVRCTFHIEHPFIPNPFLCIVCFTLVVGVRPRWVPFIDYQYITIGVAIAHHCTSNTVSYIMQR